MKTMEEYFKFLEQYWQMFEPPKEPKKAIVYKVILIQVESMCPFELAPEPYKCDR